MIGESRRLPARIRCVTTCAIIGEAGTGVIGVGRRRIIIAMARITIGRRTRITIRMAFYTIRGHVCAGQGEGRGIVVNSSGIISTWVTS